MAQTYETIIEAVQHVPTDVHNPIATGLAVAAVAGVGFLTKQYHTATNERGAYDARGNGDQIRASLIGYEAKNNKYRFAPVKKIAAGLGLVAVQYIAQPGYQSSYADAGAEAMVVADASSSMIFTHDLGQAKLSRYDAAVKAIEQADFKGKLGFIEPAIDAKSPATVISKPAQNWRALAPKLQKPVVSPNGAQLVPAMEQAAALLTEDPKTHKRDGTLVVISDGTVNESASDISEEITKLRRSGVTVRVVVPGTTSGTYRLPQTVKQSKAGVTPGVFAAASDNLRLATDSQAVTAAVQAEIKTAGTGHEHHDWPIPGALGVLALALGGGQFIERTLRKK
ncbi:MAG: VWA domain-containing protein [Patescibacteria group bacterium]|nr:VWA domain-containing protein [Patescibacteria group bacterium]